MLTSLNTTPIMLVLDIYLVLIIPTMCSWDFISSRLDSPCAATMPGRGPAAATTRQKSVSIDISYLI